MGIVPMSLFVPSVYSGYSGHRCLFPLVSELPRARWAIVAVFDKCPKHAEDRGRQKTVMHCKATI